MAFQAVNPSAAKCNPGGSRCDSLEHREMRALSYKQDGTNGPGGLWLLNSSLVFFSLRFLPTSQPVCKFSVPGAASRWDPTRPMDGAQLLCCGRGSPSVS